jgi:hypothetical protein
MRTTALVAGLFSLAVFAGCGGDEGRGATDLSPKTVTAPPRPPSALLRPPSCPAAAANCRSAAGRILYVERVDPDGDGDAHFVLASPQSVTFAGITVVDVRRDLRPSPLPGPGDLLAASGPVFRGSYGQRQIQADAVRVRRSR